MFESEFRYEGKVDFPAFTGTRVMMLPVVLGRMDSVPDCVASYRPMLERLFGIGGHRGEVGYLTVDEKRLSPGETTRRGGVHVDGIHRGAAGAWGGSWGPVGNGMLTASSYPACRAWRQKVEGWPGDEGECDHLADQLLDGKARVFGAGDIYWLDGLCVHESVPVTEDVDRQFVRLSLPSDGPWFEGYTENPLGVRPTGPVLPPRPF